MMTTTTYSIAEARNQFTALIRQAEREQQPIHITRRGHSVAVISTIDMYEQLTARQQEPDFWQMYLNWRKEWQVDEWEDDGIDPFADVRDRTPVKDINVWA